MYPNIKNAQNAYGAIQKETMTARSVEYRVFMQITSRMEQAHEKNDPKSLDFINALTDNSLLWNALAADVASVGNELPEQLKGQIFYLARYMSHHTDLVRNGEADMQAMIDINKMIMEGLAVVVKPENQEADNSANLNQTQYQQQQQKHAQVGL